MLWRERERALIAKGIDIRTKIKSAPSLNPTYPRSKYQVKILKNLISSMYKRKYYSSYGTAWLYLWGTTKTKKQNFVHVSHAQYVWKVPCKKF